MNSFLLSIFKIFCYTIAVCIILLAFAVSISRLVTPILDTHRQDIEVWASNVLKRPVTVKNANLSWYQYQPEITLENVTVFKNDDTHRQVLQIEKIRVFFSFFKSIWRREFIPSALIVSGTALDIYEKTKGEYALTGFPSFNDLNNKPLPTETKLSDFINWLSAQPNISLQNINVVFSNLKNKKYSITIKNLSFVNDNLKHAIFGDGVLNQNVSTRVALAFRWRGETFDPDKIKARLFVYVSGFSLSQWLQGTVWNGWRVAQGIVSAKVWATWDNKQVTRLQTIFTGFGINLLSTKDKTLHGINRVSAHVGWKKVNDKYIAAGDDVLIDLPNHLWPVSNFYAEYVKDDEKINLGKLSIGYLNILDVEKFILASPAGIPEVLTKFLKQYNLNGNLENLQLVTFDNNFSLQQLFFKTDFNRLSLTGLKDFPEINKLAGSITWNKKAGQIVFASENTTFNYPKIFANPLNLENLTGTIGFQQGVNSSYDLTIDNLNIENKDLNFNVNGTATIPSDYVPTVNLQAEFSLSTVKDVANYLPQKLWHKDLDEWLQHAFLKGQVTKGKASLKGPLKDYPFDNGNGEFFIEAKTNDVELHFAPNWPNVEKIEGSVTFAGRQMFVDLSYGQIAGVPIKNVIAMIPYFGDDKPQILAIQSQPIDTDFAKGMQFIHQSPLENKFGKMFKEMDINGPVLLQLGLIVPLADPDKTKVFGEINFENGIINLVRWNLTLNQLKGKLNFTEDNTNANQITGNVFDKPFTLDIRTLPNDILQATLNTNLAINDVVQWLNLPVNDVVKGQTNVETQINISFNKPLHVHLNSNLVGVQLTLPAPFNKSVDDVRNVDADLYVDDKDPVKIKVKYADLINAALLINKKRNKFSLFGVNLHLGIGDAPWPEGEGLYLSANFDKLDIDTIKKQFNNSPTTNSLGLTLRQIDVYAHHLLLGSQDITNVNLQLVPAGKNWSININSNDIQGTISAPMNVSRGGQITANFEKINLRSANTSAKNSAFSVNDVPSINFHASRMSYDNLMLGDVSFKLNNAGSGMTITPFSIKSAYLSLSAYGNWTSGGTTFRGKVLINNVTKLLNSWGVGANNFIADQGQLNFDLNWSDTPYNFAIRKMNGNFDINIKRGRIVDVGAASGAKMDFGKLLSIFSLQTIPRRLALDFSDVTQKGYSFDYLTGDFRLQNGSAFTTNTHFDGPVARVNIIGRIGLASKDLDIQMGVIPHVTSSIPVAATLLTGNPLVGIAALGVNTVLGSGISGATNYTYTVRGPWSNPSWGSSTKR